MRDYTKIVPRTPPEGLIGRALERGLLDKAALIYHCEWLPDESREAILEERERKVRKVVVRCTECLGEFVADYEPSRSKNDSASYGFSFYDPVAGDTAELTEGEEACCPLCEHEAVVLKQSTIGSGWREIDQAWLMSAAVPAVPGKPLVLTCWKAVAEVGRWGAVRFRARPYAAYVFEERDACCLTGAVRAYGTQGYFLAFKEQWGQPQSWRDVWGEETEIFGLTEALEEQSALPNCKLAKYMASMMPDENKYPIIYLRLLQKYPQAENLIVQGAGYILNDLIRARTDQRWQESYNRGRLELPEIDWTQETPSGLLRLNRDEFRWMWKMAWSPYLYRVYVTCKMLGDRLAIPEDIENIAELGDAELPEIIGRAPLGKTVRYLLKQINRQVGEEDEDDPAQPYIDSGYLKDYWSMAEKCGWDLDDPAVRWPKNLPNAHDRAMEAVKLVRAEEDRAKFAVVGVELCRYIYMSGEYLIAPACSQANLTDEGSRLGHCVGGYGRDHLSGRPIFLIRRIWAAGEPYYTLQLNLKQKKVIQNRGRRNCARTPEVQAFENEWLAWIAAGCHRKKDGEPAGAAPPVWEAPTPEEIKTEEAKTA